MRAENDSCGIVPHKCIPSSSNNFCRGTPECVPFPQNEMCDKSNIPECVPTPENNFCVGTPKCVPRKENHNCSPTNDCVPDPVKNNNCQYYPTCVPTLQNNMCQPKCSPAAENNYCRGTKECVPTESNEHCDEVLIEECKPSQANNNCVGTPECRPTAENAMCGKRCHPSPVNNFCRGTKDCIAYRSNAFCDRDENKCEPSETNSFCKGTPECVPHPSNNYCKAPEANPLKSSECAEGSALGDILAEVLAEPVLRGKASAEQMKDSARCLIDGIPLNKLPIKLFCAQQASLKKLEKLSPSSQPKLATSSPSLTLTSLASPTNNDPAPFEEGQLMESPADLPVFEVTEDDKLDETAYQKRDDGPLSEAPQEVDIVLDSNIPTESDLNN